MGMMIELKLKKGRISWHKIVWLMPIALVAVFSGCGESISEKSEQAERYYMIGKYSSAMKLWTSVGNQDPHALYMIGFMYQNGLGVREDEGEAIKWYMKSMDKGYAKSGLKLYEILVDQGSFDTAINYLRRTAEKGQARAQLLLAEIYWKEGNVDEYFKWINKAIDQGNITAKVLNEIRESEATGAPLSEEAQVFKKVMAGDADAYYQYGVIAMSSEGGSDISMAVNMFQRAAKLGHPKALYMMGKIYLGGIGVPKSCKKSIDYFRAAERKGDQDSKRGLAEAIHFCL